MFGGEFLLDKISFWQIIRGQFARFRNGVKYKSFHVAIAVIRYKTF